MGLMFWGSRNVVLPLILQVGKLRPRAHGCQRRRRVLAGALVLLTWGGTSLGLPAPQHPWDLLLSPRASPYE